jgi:hypothetical protein
LDNFQIKDKQLLQEVLEHANFCIEIVDKFHGRNDLLDQVLKKTNPKNLKLFFSTQLTDYITRPTEHPFFVHGESGCGKTSVIAKFVTQVSCLESIKIPFYMA